ncbi:MULTISPECIES: hypothetical protein [Leptospira]|nr:MULTISPECIES: hypothetical protein [Leptospira]MBW0436060.1 hypothetical protein [Leptospira yasudae]
MVTTGYERISISLTIDTAPAFNIVYRILTPALLLIFYAAILSNTDYDYLNRKIAFVNYYYVSIRILVIIIYGRTQVVNWRRQLITFLGIILVTYFLDENYLHSSTKILPDPVNLINELWIIILIFIYNLLNKIGVSPEDSDKRKKNYILNKYNIFSKKWKDLVLKSKGEILYSMIFSIMIYENFNRPWIFRKTENLLKKLKFPILTTGIMQFNSTSNLSDEESIKLCIKFLRRRLIKVLKDGTQSSLRAYHFIQGPSYNAFLDDIIQQYNVRSDYYREIAFINEIIESKLNSEINQERNTFRLNKLIARYLILNENTEVPDDSGPFGDIDYESLKRTYFKRKYRL